MSSLVWINRSTSQQVFGIDLCQLEGTIVVSRLDLLVVTGAVEVADLKIGAGRAISARIAISQN